MTPRHPTPTLPADLAARVAADWEAADIPWASPWTWGLALAATLAGAFIPWERLL